MPGSESLEDRRLLSSVTHAGHAAHADLLVPPAAEVASATAMLQTRAGSDFQKLATDLQHVEQASRVTPAQFAILEYDATTIDMAIKTSGMAARQASQQLSAIQDVLDQSFLAGANTKGGWTQLESKVSANLQSVMVSSAMTQSQVSSMSPQGVLSNQTVQLTFDQMKTIARLAHVTAAEHAQIVADEQAV